MKEPAGSSVWKEFMEYLKMIIFVVIVVLIVNNFFADQCENTFRIHGTDHYDRRPCVWKQAGLSV